MGAEPQGEPAKRSVCTRVCENAVDRCVLGGGEGQCVSAEARVSVCQHICHIPWGQAVVQIPPSLGQVT